MLVGLVHVVWDFKQQCVFTKQKVCHRETLQQPYVGMDEGCFALDHSFKLMFNMKRV